MTVTQTTSNTGGSKPSLFLSYGRNDDEAFVAQLYADLKNRAFEVWWDRKSMPSRDRTFTQEIRDAIDRHDRLILIVGPAAMASKYVRQEWGYAREAQKVIIPILRVGDYTLLPQELSRLHCPDFGPSRPYGEALEELLRILQEPVPEVGSVRRVPAYPPHFLPRAEQFERLKELVLADVVSPAVITAARRTTVLHGMPGSGKSVLAATFARATEVRRSLTDGVIWLNIGQEPDLLNRLRAVGQAFDDPAVYYIDVDAAQTRLAVLLEKRVYLIVLDDVWEVEHAAPVLNSLGPRSRLLITTRDAGIATALGGQEYRLGELSDDEALDLLAGWTGVLSSGLPAEARQVAAECGNLPLALALSGAMARDGTSWRDLLAALREADLDFIEAHFANYPYPTVFKTLKVSMDALETRDAMAAELYRELVVFPESVAPETAVLTLWRPSGHSDRQLRKVLTQLERKALLRLEGEEPGRRVSLHDLQHDYLRGIQGDVTRLHRRFVDAYARQCSDGWPSGPNDGYYFEHLVYHLIQAGRMAEELVTLVADPRWQRARRSDVLAGSGLIQDVERVRTRAAAGGIADLPEYIAASLLFAWLRTEGTIVPIEVVETLGRLGDVGLARGWAELSVGDERRAAALARLARVCLECNNRAAAMDLLREARSRIEVTGKIPWRVNWLTWLAGSMQRAGEGEEARQTFDSAIRLVKEEVGPEREEAMHELVTAMADYEEPFLTPALQIAEDIAREDGAPSGRVIAHLAELYQNSDVDHSRHLAQEVISTLLTNPESFFPRLLARMLPNAKLEALKDTVGFVAKFGTNEQTEGLLNSLSNGWLRWAAGIVAGQALAQLKHIEEARGYLLHASASTEMEQQGGDADGARQQLVAGLLEVGEVERAKEVAARIVNAIDRVNAFAQIAEHLACLGRLDEARSWSVQEGTEWGKAVCASAIGASLIEVDPQAAYSQLDEALRLASEIREGIVGARRQTQALIGRAIYRLAASAPHFARQLLGQMVSGFWAITGSDAMAVDEVSRARDDAFTDLIEALASTGAFCQGLSIAPSINGDFNRDYALLLCVRGALIQGDGVLAERILSHMTTPCWTYIATIARDAWQGNSDLLSTKGLRKIRRQAPKVCEGWGDPIQWVGRAAIEVGLAGHVRAARTLFRTRRPLEWGEHQVELARLLVRRGVVEDAQELVQYIKYGSFKAKALGYIARHFLGVDDRRFESLLDTAWKELDAVPLPPRWFIRPSGADDALIVLAGTITGRDLAQADLIVTQWIEKDDKRQRARAEVITGLAATNPDLAYTRLRTLLDQAAAKGLQAFWRALSDCSESVGIMLGEAGLMRLYNVLMLVEARAKQ